MATKQQVYEVACFMRRLEEDKSIRIAFENLDGIYGLVYKGHNSKFLMIINKNICYEKQLETIWHEAKHIYSHADCSPGDIKIFEKEAVEFSKIAIKHPEILALCRNAW